MTKTNDITKKGMNTLNRVFPQRIPCEVLSSGRAVKLLGNYVFKLPGFGKFVAEKGFVSDFASSPRAAWSIVPPWGKYSPAALGHDWLYSAGKNLNIIWDEDIYTKTQSDIMCQNKKLWENNPRKFADDFFNQAMIDLNVKTWRRKTMYRLVRLLGWKRWNELGRQEIKGNGECK